MAHSPPTRKHPDFGSFVSLQTINHYMPLYVVSESKQTEQEAFVLSPVFWRLHSLTRRGFTVDLTRATPLRPGGTDLGAVQGHVGHRSARRPRSRRRGPRFQRSGSDPQAPCPRRSPESSSPACVHLPCLLTDGEKDTLTHQENILSGSVQKMPCTEDASFNLKKISQDAFQKANPIPPPAHGTGGCPVPRGCLPPT